jgi:hypothetical protein
VYVCNCVSVSERERERESLRQESNIVSLPVTHVAHGANTLCRGPTAVVAVHPKQGVGTIREALPNVHCVICYVHLSPSFSPTHTSYRLPSSLSSHLPLILAAVEIKCINVKCMRMTAPKLELQLPGPWRLSVSPCNRHSAK